MARLLSFPKPGAEILFLIVAQFGQDVKTKPEKVYAKTQTAMHSGENGFVKPEKAWYTVHDDRPSGLSAFRSALCNEVKTWRV